VVVVASSILLAVLVDLVEEREITQGGVEEDQLITIQDHWLKDIQVDRVLVIRQPTLPAVVEVVQVDQVKVLLMDQTQTQTQL
jgi:hypothetical protein